MFIQVYRLEPDETYFVDGTSGFLHHDGNKLIIWNLITLSNHIFWNISWLKGYEETEEYCVDIAEPDSQLLVLKCDPGFTMEQETCDNDGDNPGSFQMVFTCLGVISLVFLAITFIIYITIPELGNTHGMIVLSNVVSVFLVTSYLLTVYNIQPDSSLSCSVLGYMVWRGKVIRLWGWTSANDLSDIYLICLLSRVTLQVWPCFSGWQYFALTSATPS